MENSTVVTFDLSPELFSRVFATSPRKAREILFSRYGVKNKKRIGLVKASDNDEKVRKLHEKLRNAVSAQEKNLMIELVRNWLYTRRPMLKSALDFLSVANNDGLVEVETDFFATLEAEKAKQLLAHLNANFDGEEVRVYLKFMAVPL